MKPEQHGAFALACLLAFASASAFWLGYRLPAGFTAAYALFLLWQVFAPSKGIDDDPRFFLRFGELSWTRDDARRHWLCVGKTGCGKTVGFLKTFLLTVLRKDPTCGGVMLDEKGDFHELVTKVFTALKITNKLLVFRVPLPGEQLSQDAPTMNLIGDRSIPWDTHAQIVIDVAVSQGQKSTQPFFKVNGRDVIATIFETLENAGIVPTLAQAYDFMNSESDRAAVLEGLANSGEERAMELFVWWQSFESQDAGQRDGIRKTVEAYLKPYASAEIRSVFCDPDGTSSIALVDAGKWMMASIPQVFLTPRRYVAAYFKVGIYMHGLRRFDRGSSFLSQANTVYLMIDEAQNSLLPAEDGMSDINTSDKLRAAGVVLVLAMQDFASAIPQLESRERAEVLFANTTNKVIYTLETPAGRKIAADIIGEEEQQELSVNYDNKGRTSTNRAKRNKHLVAPIAFKKLPKHTCYIQHCERGQYCKTMIKPLSDDGTTIAPWFKRRRWL